MATLTNIDGFMLDAGPNWDRYTPEERETICNGVGPEAWPQKRRAVLDKFPFLLAASRVHDVDFERGGGFWAWVAANWRFRKNCYRVAQAHFDNEPDTPEKAIEWRAASLYIDLAFLALMLGSRAHWNSEPTLEPRD